MSSSAKKKRKTTRKPSKRKEPSLEWTPNPSLPDDLLVSCFALVPRMYYPTLSLVSKNFRSVLSSPELYNSRSSLGRTESCLYVYLRFPPNPTPRWYTLSRKPNSTLSTRKDKKKKPCGYVLAATTMPHSPPAYPPALVSIGSNIYNIGGPIGDNKEPSSRVLILDCRSQTWLEAPSMRVERNYPVAFVVDGKIYVAGGGKDCNSSNWMEVFDPDTQTWEFVTCPISSVTKICGDYVHKSVGADGKVCLSGSDYNLGVVYKPKRGTWETFNLVKKDDWIRNTCIMIGNVVYSYDNGVFKWYDHGVWRKLMGVKGLPMFPGFAATLTDYGGKMAVLWYVDSSCLEKMTIWCAVIALERRNNVGEIWGKVEWYGVVLTVPYLCTIECAISVTV